MSGRGAGGRKAGRGGKQGVGRGKGKDKADKPPPRKVTKCKYHFHLIFPEISLLDLILSCCCRFGFLVGVGWEEGWGFHILCRINLWCRYFQKAS